MSTRRSTSSPPRPTKTPKKTFSKLSKTEGLWTWTRFSSTCWLTSLMASSTSKTTLTTNCPRMTMMTTTSWSTWMKLIKRTSTNLFLTPSQKYSTTTSTPSSLMSSERKLNTTRPLRSRRWRSMDSVWKSIRSALRASVWRMVVKKWCWIALRPYNTSRKWSGKNYKHL